MVQAANTTVRSLCGLDCPCKSSPAKTSDTDLNGRTWVQPNNEACVGPNEEAWVRNESDRTQDRQQPTDNDDKEVTPRKCKENLTLNMTIPDIHCTIPKVAEIALCSRLSIVNSGSDISKFFSSIMQSIPSSMLNALMVYQDADTKMPSFSRFSSVTKTANEKQVLLSRQNLFGLSDLSTACLAALQKAPCIYEEHLQSKVNLDYAAQKLKEAGINAEWILHDDKRRRYIIEFARRCLQMIYVDDFSQNVNLRHACGYILCTKNSLQGVNEEMILSSALELHCYSAAFVILCLSFTNMSFKSFDTPTIFHQNLNNLITSLKRKTIKPDLEKPEIEQIRLENKYVAEEDSLGEEKKGIYLTQLGVHYY